MKLHALMDTIPLYLPQLFWENRVEPGWSVAPETSKTRYNRKKQLFFGYFINNYLCSPASIVMKLDIYLEGYNFYLW